MTNLFSSICLTFSLVALVGCKGSGGKGNGNSDMAGTNNGGGNFSVVSATASEPAGANCATGGIRVDVGLDNGDGGGVARNDQLESGEIDKTEFICTESMGFPPITKTTALGLNDPHCLFGGSQVDYGLDDGSDGGVPKNGLLEEGEIDGTTYACLPMPPGLLVKTVDLFPGDPTCPFGGQTIYTGLDDGKPTGTAGDSILQDDEIDLTTTRCAASPDDVFPEITGTAGSATIDVQGGAGSGSGSGGARAGSFTAAIYGGPLPAALELRTIGAATPTTTPPTVALPATFSHTIDAPTLVTTSATEIAGFHLRGDPNTSYTLPLYFGATLVTSLDITMTGELTFEAPAVEVFAVRARIEGPVRNAGTIRAIANSTATSPPQPRLRFECETFVNEATGLVETRGPSGTGDLELVATFGPGGAIVNHGTISTAGFDADTSAATASRDLYLIAASHVINDGKIDAHGTSGNATEPLGTGGGYVEIQTLRGNLYHYGTIDVRGGSGGGDGDAPSGGGIRLFNGLRYGPSPELPDALADLTNYGPGELHATGELLADGGTSPEFLGGGGNIGGGGGTITVRISGGVIRATSTFSARGGNSLTNYSGGGAGGQITVVGLTWVPLVGGQTLVVPDELTLSGPLLAAGGVGEGVTDYRGGAGGTIRVRLDAATTNSATDGVIVPPFDRNDLRATGKTPRLLLLGYASVEGDGGSGPFASSAEGGAVTLHNRVCGDALECLLVEVGPRRVRTDVPIYLRGGNATSSGVTAGRGGSAELSLDSEGATPTVYSAAAIELRASIDVSGGAIDNDGAGNATGGSGGTISVRTDVGAIAIDAGLDAAGGVGSTAQADSGEGGAGGHIELGGFSIAVNAELRLAGGAGTRFGDGGVAQIEGYTVGIDAMIDVSGAYNAETVRIGAVQRLDHRGAIVSQGRQSRFSSPNEGSIVRLSGGVVNLEGTIDATGSASSSGASQSSGDGGDVEVTGASVICSGTIDVSGGNVTTTGTAQAGGAGEITITTPSFTGTGTLRAAGGTAFPDAALGVATAGRGGNVTIEAGNAAAIDVRGGDASGTSTSNGGDGGTVRVTGNNSGPIDATGGTATGGTATPGAGGFVQIDGTNTACVQAQSIVPADLPNFCS